jgi:hypothetical protein
MGLVFSVKKKKNEFENAGNKCRFYIWKLWTLVLQQFQLQDLIKYINTYKKKKK